MYSKATNRIIATVWFLVVTLGILYTPHAAWANIDGTDKWAWSTNAGWLNFKDTNGGASVYADQCRLNLSGPKYRMRFFIGIPF